MGIASDSSGDRDKDRVIKGENEENAESWEDWHACHWKLEVLNVCIQCISLLH